MKYILPLVLSLVFTACNDSDKTKNESMSTNSTSIEQVITNVEQEKVEVKPVQEVVKVEVNGETIFSKCKSCHGNSAEKKALGTSQVIKGWDVAKIEKTLQGYKEGTYGREMKNIMSAQAKVLSDEEIKKVAVYIHSL
ncbi:c-type cytochrome [bacterium]|nr:c-type cytochrome [bacterium]MBU1884814.1 c-type cytochrome [bacterium]